MGHGVTFSHARPPTILTWLEPWYRSGRATSKITTDQIYWHFFGTRRPENAPNITNFLLYQALWHALDMSVSHAQTTGSLRACWSLHNVAAVQRCSCYAWPLAWTMQARHMHIHIWKYWNPLPVSCGIILCTCICAIHFYHVRRLSIMLIYIIIAYYLWRLGLVTDRILSISWTVKSYI